MRLRRRSLSANTFLPQLHTRRLHICKVLQHHTCLHNPINPRKKGRSQGIERRGNRLKKDPLATAPGTVGVTRVEEDCLEPRPKTEACVVLASFQVLDGLHTTRRSDMDPVHVPVAGPSRPRRAPGNELGDRIMALQRRGAAPPQSSRLALIPCSRGTKGDSAANCPDPGSSKWTSTPEDRLPAQLLSVDYGIPANYTLRRRLNLNLNLVNSSCQRSTRRSDTIPADRPCLHLRHYHPGGTEIGSGDGTGNVQGKEAGRTSMIGNMTAAPPLGWTVPLGPLHRLPAVCLIQMTRWVGRPALRLRALPGGKTDIRIHTFSRTHSLRLHGE